MKMTLEELNQKLIAAYQSMYELTNPECRACRTPLSCCSPEYCDIARAVAKENWGTDLKPVDGAGNLPFMGKTGCVVPPHMRPACTVHHCQINSIGMFLNNIEKTTQWFTLKQEIDRLEWKKFKIIERDAKHSD